RPGARKGIADDVAHPLPDERNPRERLPEVAPAPDHRLAAGVDRAAGLGEARKQLEYLSVEFPPEHHPREGGQVRDLLLDSCYRRLAPDLRHGGPPISRRTALPILPIAPCPPFIMPPM